MEKQLIISTCMSAILSLAIAQPSRAMPTTITDTYWGGDSHGDTNDVIGSTSVFGITSMDVERVGDTLNVSINTNFAGRGDDGYFDGTSGHGSNLTKGLGIGYGDLFLSSAWNPYGTGPEYKSDNNSNGTIWTYGFSLDDHWMEETSTGTGTLYSLNSANNNADALLSEDFLTGGTYRNGQEIAVDTANGNVSTVAGNTSSWDITTGSINFYIDLTGTDLLYSDTFALHWGMTCGNDTIEGEYSVPEPAILGLLALGLIGIGVSQRKRN